MLCYLVALLSQSTVCSLIASTLAILRWVSGIEVYICAGEAMYWIFFQMHALFPLGFLPLVYLIMTGIGGLLVTISDPLQTSE